MQPEQRSAQVALTTVGGLGLIALVLPFAMDISPHRALTEWGQWRLALPAYLVVFIVPASVRWIVRGVLSSFAQAVGYALAAGGVLLLALSLLRLEAWPDGAVQWVTVAGPVLILGFGAVAFVRNLRAGRPRSYGPILALQVVYIANTMLALAIVFPGWQAGAYVALVAMMAYAIQIDLVRKAPEQPHVP